MVKRQVELSIAEIRLLASAISERGTKQAMARAKELRRIAASPATLRELTAMMKQCLAAQEPPC